MKKALILVMSMLILIIGYMWFNHGNNDPAVAIIISCGLIPSITFLMYCLSYDLFEDSGYYAASIIVLLSIVFFIGGMGILDTAFEKWNLFAGAKEPVNAREIMSGLAELFLFALAILFGVKETKKRAEAEGNRFIIQ